MVVYSDSESRSNYLDYKSFYQTRKNLESFKCDKCEKSYTLKANLIRHQKVECGKQPQEKCSACNFVTYYRSDLLRHFNKRHVFNNIHM